MATSKDPRGPIRQIVALDPIVLDCGHRPDLNPIFSYRIGDECRCFRCGKEEMRDEH